MKATELLQKQHRDVEALLERLHTAAQGDEARIRQELAANLVAHSMIEREIFYPAIREAMPIEILEAMEEHGLFEIQLARLLTAKPGEDVFEAKSAVLAEQVVRHIRREEAEILKTADRELGDEHLNHLGDQMLMRFRQVMDAGFPRFLRKAVEEELPRTPARAARAKKTARRAPATAKKAKGARRAAGQARTTRRAAPTKRATPKRGTRPSARKAVQGRKTTPRAQKPARAARTRRSSASARART